MAELTMTQNEALRWLKQVDGSIFHNSETACESAWVAVVRTPAPQGRRGKIILAFGETLSAAAGAAEQEWQTLWESFGSSH